MMKSFPKLHQIWRKARFSPSKRTLSSSLPWSAMIGTQGLNSSTTNFTTIEHRYPLHAHCPSHARCYNGSVGRYIASNSFVQHSSRLGGFHQSTNKFDESSNSLGKKKSDESNKQAAFGNGGRASLSPLVRKFGPRGHDYTYASYAGPSISTMAEAEIDKLLSARLQEKMVRNYEAADTIRKKLNDVGVYVLDKRKEWRADGLMFDYGAQKYNGLENGELASSEHHYIQSPGAGPIQCPTLTWDEIHKLLEERHRARITRDFARADQIRDHLASEGVTINDKTKEWRADGVRYSLGEGFSGSPNYKDRAGRSGSRRIFGANGHDYTLAPEAGPPTTVLSEKEIHQLLSERLKFRVLRDFVNADRIREELSDQGVFVDDRKKLWRGDGVEVEDDGYLGKSRDFGPMGHDYTLAPDAGPNTSNFSEDLIHELLKERLQAKMARDFVRADRIREILKEEGVYVDDGSREWRADNVNFEFIGSIGGYNEDDDATKTSHEP
jgi:cysteinyl-tRNA synthetase